MYTYKAAKLPKNTFEVILSIPKEDIQIEYDFAFPKLQNELIVEGFRKGKVPKDIAQKYIKKEEVYQELLKNLLSRIYEEIVKKEGYKPVVNPKVDLVSAKENEDWEVKITIVQKPIVDLGDYKKKLKEVKDASKKSEIWVPGKDKAPPDEKSNQETRQKLLNELLSALLASTSVEISDLILEEELNNRLSRLLDDIQKLGLTVENYLKSKNTTMDEVKKHYKREIEDTYKLEFLLSEIADSEKIEVKKEDLDKLFVNIRDEKEKKAAAENSYFYASILRKQKTLDFLLDM